MSDFDRKHIELRFLIHQRNDKFEAICLELDITNRANTMTELQQKIIDSTFLYLTSFSLEEIKEHKYIRKAPLYYRFIWNVGNVLHSFLNYNIKKGDFNVSSKELSFA